MKRILFLFMGFLGTAQAAPVTLSGLPIPPPYNTSQNRFSDMDLDLLHFNNLVTAWEFQNAPFINQVREYFTRAVYVRTEVTCNVHSFETKQIWDSHLEIKLETKDLLVQAISRLIGVSKNVMVPASLQITVNEEEPESCDGHLKVWGTPMAGQRVLGR